MSIIGYNFRNNTVMCGECVLMLVFLCIILVAVILFSIVFLSEIRVEINDKVTVSAYFLGKIKWFCFNLAKKKTVLGSKFEVKRILWLIRNFLKRVKIQKLNLKLLVGVDDVLLTSYFIGIISALLPNLIRNNIDDYSKDKYNYTILPVYNNGNVFYIELNCILSIKLVHIINMLSKYKKEKHIKVSTGGNDYERTSNRRINAYCNGKH